MSGVGVPVAGALSHLLVGWWAGSLGCFLAFLFTFILSACWLAVALTTRRGSEEGGGGGWVPPTHPRRRRPRGGPPRGPPRKPRG